MDPRIEAVRRAISDEGRSPQQHRATMAQHRSEWPTLWRAIDGLLAGRPVGDET